MGTRAWIGIFVLGACGGVDTNPLNGDGATDGMSTDGSGMDSAMDTGVTDATPDQRQDGGLVSPIGCSDGTREAFINMGTHPNIPACSGGFSVAGVTTSGSMTPQCNRLAGNSSVNPAGNGCSVEDLCAAGWQVCTSASDVQSHSGNGMCDLMGVISATSFWLTRQSEDQNGNCVQGGHNNIVGCNIGMNGGFAPGNNCAPLNYAMWYGMCMNFPPWQCGNAGTPYTEADLVTKSGADHGGVICCRM